MFDEITQISEMVGAIVAIGTVVSALIVKFVSIISANNIEIAFMTKKQQWKYTLANLFLFFILLLVVNVIYTLLALFSRNVDFWKECRNVTIVLWTIIMIIWGIVFAGTILSEIRLFKVVYIIMKNIVKKAENFIRSKVEKIQVKLKRRAKDKVKYRKIQSICSKCHNNVRKICLLWKECKSNEITYTPKVKLKIVTFIFTILMGISINGMAVLTVDISVTIVSVLLFSVLSVVIAIAVLGLNWGMGKARIYFCDKDTSQYVFVYFRQDDNFCVGGDMPKEVDCKEYIIISYEEVIKQKLYSISKYEKAENISASNQE